MAYRQYIGARYVPLYAGDWDGTRNYEPLTIVTDANGNSYTSMKDVPAGTPLNDRNYWILTSSFSGAVEQLRRNVNTIQSDVDALQNDVSVIQTNVTTLDGRVATVEKEVKKAKKNGRKFICIGDSFSMGYIPTGSGYTSDPNGWAIKARDILGEDCYIWNYMNPPAGYTGSTGFTSSLKFLRMLQYIVENDVADTSTITDVVVFGGSNDKANANAIPEAIDEFMQYVRAKLPNASVKIGVLGTGAVKDHGVVRGYSYATMCGAELVVDLINLMCDPQFLIDGTHLTSNGYEYYVNYILEAMFTGHSTYSFDFSCEGFARQGVTIYAGTPRVAVTVSNSGVKLAIRSSNTVWLATNVPPTGSPFMNFAAPLIYIPEASGYGVALPVTIYKVENGKGGSIHAIGYLYMTVLGQLSIAWDSGFGSPAPTGSQYLQAAFNPYTEGYYPLKIDNKGLAFIDYP